MAERPATTAKSTTVEEALPWIVKEAFRTAINMWPATKACEVQLRVVPSGEFTSVRHGPSWNPSKGSIITLTVPTEDVRAALTSLSAQTELGSRLGRWYVYDLGLADGA